LWVKGNYTNGEKEGSWVSYNKTGSVTFDERWSGTFKNGEKISD
jgi:antitoxin component YwqK of YwqJK toxin-antitoxin module